MNYVRAQGLIDRGRGKAALRLGQPFDVYRIQPNDALNYLDAVNTVNEGFLVLRRPNKTTPVIEGTLLTAVSWEVVGDFSSWLLGDVFIQSDPIFGLGATEVEGLEFVGFCLAYHGPVKKTIGLRLDRLCSIFRPLQGGADANGYFSGDTRSAQPLLLQTGTFVFGNSNDAPALVPVGLTSHIRARGDIFKEVPTSTGESIFMMYIPPLNGYEPREADKIQMQDGSEYVLHTPFEQEAGIVGQQIVCTRTRARSS